MKRFKLILGITVLIILFVLLWDMGIRSHRCTVFEPGIISTQYVEYAPTFTSSGKEMYFARSAQKWASRDMKSAIYYARKVKGQWSEPELVSFSGQHDDSDPHLSDDGKTLFFISDRPSEGQTESSDIWKVTKNEGGQWHDAKRLAAPVNSESTEYSPRTDGYGNLYFASDRPGGYGQGDLYLSMITATGYEAPVNLGPVLNSKTGEWNLEINSEGDLIIFEASQRPENVTAYGDLYISFKRDDSWSAPQNITELNTSGSDLYPWLSEDEKTLIYTSSDSLKSVDTNIYITKFSRLCRQYKKEAIYIP